MITRDLQQVNPSTTVTADPSLSLRLYGPGEQPRILSTHNKKNHPAWLKRVELPRNWQADVDRNFVRLRASYRSPLLRDLKWAWKIFLASRDYDVLLTGSERLALLIALLQRWMPRKRRVRHVLLECMWTLPPGGFARWRRRFLLRRVAEATDRIIVYARHQIEAYAALFDIPKRKFRFIPSHSTLYSKPQNIKSGNYIFSGGYTNRDYRTLFAAVRGLPCEVVACVSSKQRLDDDIPANVTVLQDIDEEEFNNLMAGSAFVVVPLKGGVLESGGRQVFQNAMTMGKAVIVTDTLATDYIVNGVNGLLVPAGSSSEVREAILNLLQNPGLALNLGIAAQKASADFAPELFFERVFAVVEDVICTP